MSDSSLTGQVVLVTGAGRGIGRACALGFAAGGARVALAARSKDELTTVADQIRQRGGDVVAVPTDVTDFTACEDLVEAVTDALGPIDVLVNNAGGGNARHTLVKSDPAEWAASITLNLVGVFHVCRSVLPQMIERQRGRIINIGSGTGYASAPGTSAYGSAKAGVAQLTRVLADEVAKHGIDVNEVVPGPVATKLTEGLFAPGSPPAFAPTERVKEPEEVAELVLWLAARPALGPTGQMFSLARRSLL